MSYEDHLYACHKDIGPIQRRQLAGEVWLTVETVDKLLERIGQADGYDQIVVQMGVASVLAAFARADIAGEPELMALVYEYEVAAHTMLTYNPPNDRTPVISLYGLDTIVNGPRCHALLRLLRKGRNDVDKDTIRQLRRFVCEAMSLILDEHPAT